MSDAVARDADVASNCGQGLDDDNGDDDDDDGGDTYKDEGVAEDEHDYEDDDDDDGDDDAAAADDDDVHDDDENDDEDDDDEVGSNKFSQGMAVGHVWGRSMWARRLVRTRATIAAQSSPRSA